MKAIPIPTLGRAAVAAALTMAACSDSGSDTTPVTFQVIEETTFAPALSVNLAEMTRTASGTYIQVLEEGNGDQIGASSSVAIAS